MSSRWGAVRAVSRRVARASALGNQRRGCATGLRYRGRHCLVDVRDAVVTEDVDGFAEEMLRTLSEAAWRAGVTVVGEQLRVFDGLESPPGFAMAILLDESHISLHMYADLGLMAFDCFTCGNVEATLEITDRFRALIARRFERATLRQRTVDRFPYSEPAHGREEDVAAGSGAKPVSAPPVTAATPASGLPVSILLDVTGVHASCSRYQVELLQGASFAVRRALGHRGAALQEVEASVTPGGGSLSCVFDNGHVALRLRRGDGALLVDVTAVASDLADTVAAALEGYLVDAHPGARVQRHRVERLRDEIPSACPSV